MATPRTWTLLEKVRDHLQGITTANGFASNVGPAATLEPAQIPNEAGAALAVAMDSLARAEDPALKAVGHLFRFAVFAKVGTGQNDAQQKLHQLIADVTARMADKAVLLPTLPPGTQFPTFVEASVVPPVEGMKWIGAVVRYSAHITNR